MFQSVLNKTVLKPAKAVSMHVSHTAHEELCMAAAGPARTVLIGTGWTSSFHVHMVAALYGGREGSVSKYNDDERCVSMFCCRSCFTSAMFRFIDDEELFSEGELSDVLPFHAGGQVRESLKPSDESSSSESESDHESRLKRKKKRFDKENRRGKGSTKEPNRKKKRPQSPCDESILFELKKTNELVANLTKKMKKHESRLKAIENKLSETTSVSSSSNSTLSGPQRGRMSHVKSG